RHRGAGRVEGRVRGEPEEAGGRVRGRVARGAPAARQRGLPPETAEGLRRAVRRHRLGRRGGPRSRADRPRGAGRAAERAALALRHPHAVRPEPAARPPADAQGVPRRRGAGDGLRPAVGPPAAPARGEGRPPRRRRAAQAVGRRELNEPTPPTRGSGRASLHSPGASPMRLLACCLLALPAAVAAADEFKPEPGFALIFNGKDFTGWKTLAAKDKPSESLDGKAEAFGGRFKAQGGELVIDPKVKGDV